jgi:FtsP/CotA-like multicopper oxidase with cupredoxin domain
MEGKGMKARPPSRGARRGLLLAVAALCILSTLLSVFPAAAAPAQPVAALPVARALTTSSLPASTCTLVDSTRTCELWALPGSITLADGTTAPIWGFGDNALGPAELPGPLLVANAGETLEVVFHNEVPGETIALVFPGHEGVIPDLDGVATGAMTTYTIELAGPGTFLYEAGLTPNGVRQVAMGLYGALIVRGATPGQAYDDASTAYDDEALLVLSELDPALNDDPNNFDLTAYAPRYALINGQSYPETAEIQTTAGATVLLRYVNAGLRSHSMGLLGVVQAVIASDGHAKLPTHRSLVEQVASGQTLDALVTIPAMTTFDTRFAVYDTNLLLHNASQRLAPGAPVAFGGTMTFLRTVDGAAPAETGPTAVAMIDPTPTTGAAGVTLTVRLDDNGSGGLNVVAAEYFVGGLGPVGAGTPISVPTPAPVVDLAEFISAAELDTWVSGHHAIYVRGQDADGNWGPAGATVLNLDKTGPSSMGLSLAPEPTNGTRDVLLRATGDDRLTGRGYVVEGAYVLNGNPPEPLMLDRVDSTVTAMTAIIPSALLTGLPEGQYGIEVSAMDTLGNWGPAGLLPMNLDKTGPLAPAATLTPSTLDLSGAPPVIAVRLQADISDALSGGTQSPLANAEGFIGAPGAAGTGFRLFASDGLYDEVDERVYFDIPVATFLWLAQGQHMIYVHGLDAAGNWGELGSATITIDRGTTDLQGPVISGLLLDPNPTNGAPAVALTASATDPGLLSVVAGGEWFVGADPGVGNGQPLLAADGAFNSTSEQVLASLNVSGWANGTHQVRVRARDTLSNWGPVTSMALRVQANAPLLLWADSFEGGLGLWDAAVGNLVVTPDALLTPDGGTQGLEIGLDGTGAAAQAQGPAAVMALSQEGEGGSYVSHLLPAGETGYVAWFDWDPNSATLGELPLDLLLGLHNGAAMLGIEAREVAQVAPLGSLLPAAAPTYEVRGWALAAGVPTTTAWYAIDDGAHRLGLSWHAGAEVGWLSLSVDGAVVENLTGLDTSAYLLREVRLGPARGVDPEASGSEYFDGYVARRLQALYAPAALTPLP